MAIDSIRKHSQDMYKRTALIDEPVVQINLLALNASVEAAWALDQCYGFAVVATTARLVDRCVNNTEPNKLIRANVADADAVTLVAAGFVDWVAAICEAWTTKNGRRG